ncbi:MAG: hypothetical protein EZS28_005495 [Streblomastix strix]|uniref:Uncharacterized protein n=2 Tax=Streblomastix strix TaxID=222440 RepID=A0A5J4WWU7_9EUKA|nr:MAG: hypothetical protein EZS28_005495 [Streblomastix strix]
MEEDVANMHFTKIVMSYNDGDVVGALQYLEKIGCDKPTDLSDDKNTVLLKQIALYLNQILRGEDIQIFEKNGYQFFIKGGGNVQLYKKAQLVLLELWEEAFHSRGSNDTQFQVLDVGVGTGEALFPVIKLFSNACKKKPSIYTIEPSKNWHAQTSKYLQNMQQQGLIESYIGLNINAQQLSVKKKEKSIKSMSSKYRSTSNITKKVDQNLQNEINDEKSISNIDNTKELKIIPPLPTQMNQELFPSGTRFDIIQSSFTLHNMSNREERIEFMRWARIHLKRLERKQQLKVKTRRKENRQQIKQGDENQQLNDSKIDNIPISQNRISSDSNISKDQRELIKLTDDQIQIISAQAIPIQSTSPQSFGSISSYPSSDSLYSTPNEQRFSSSGEIKSNYSNEQLKQRIEQQVFQMTDEERENAFIGSQVLASDPMQLPEGQLNSFDKQQEMVNSKKHEEIHIPKHHKPRSMLVLIEFNMPSYAADEDPLLSRRRVEYFRQTYANGLQEYRGDENFGIVSQGFLIPVMLGKFDREAVRSASKQQNAAHEQSKRAWVVELQEAGFKKIETRFVANFWWADAFAIIGRV